MGGGGSKTAPEGENEEDELPKETEADKKDPNNKPLDVGKDFGGPCKKRKCTDFLCTLLLAFAWFCMTVVGFACIPGNDLDQATGLKKGNPYKLINGIDYKDRVCGIDSDVKDRLKLYYFYLRVAESASRSARRSRTRKRSIVRTTPRQNSTKLLRRKRWAGRWPW